MIRDFRRRLRRDALVPRRGRRRLAVAVLAVGAMSLVLLRPAVSVSAETGCSGYSSYSALAAAHGVHTYHAAPGLLLTDADASLPAAQAEVGTLSGSVGWAGAPYSSTVAGNVGRAARASDVPVFALSSHPGEPESKKTTPAATIEAKTGPQSAAASVVGGGPTSDQASVGRVTTTAVSQCRDDNAIEAVADNEIETLDIDGVLRVGSVRSHAEAGIDPSGERVLEGTMEVQGASVLGQSVSITDRGVVTGESATPLPDSDPLADALADAGIEVRYVAAAKDAEQGQVLAPGLEIVVTRGVEGVGTGPATTTYTLGRAFARAVGTSDGTTSAVDDVVTTEGSQTSAPPMQEATPTTTTGEESIATQPSAETPTPSAPTTASPDVPAETGEPEVAMSLPTSLIANASHTGVYATLGAGTAVLVAAWLVFDKLGGRLKWR